MNRLALVAFFITFACSSSSKNDNDNKQTETGAGGSSGSAGSAPDASTGGGSGGNAGSGGVVANGGGSGGAVGTGGALADSGALDGPVGFDCAATCSGAAGCSKSTGQCVNPAVGLYCNQCPSNMIQLTIVKSTMCSGICISNTLVCAVEATVESAGPGPYTCPLGAHIALTHSSCSEPLYQICAWD